MVCVYVDDLLVTGSSLQSTFEFKQEMTSKFEMSDLGRLTYYLGIEVLQYDGGVVLSQDKYARKILEEAGMNNCNLVHVPIEVNTRLSKSILEKGNDEREYRRTI